MKKLLTILTVVLALCLLCSLALAEGTEDSELEKALAYVSRLHDMTEEGHELILIGQKDPTCTEKGYYTFHCTKDDFVHNVERAALGHDIEKSNVIEATCIAAGSYDWKCKREGCTATGSEVVPQLAHLWSSDIMEENWGAIIEAPTCTKEGKAVDMCVRCMENKTNGADVNGDNTINNYGLDGVRDPEKSRVIPKIPHDNNGKDYQKPTCLTLKVTDRVKMVEYCTMCGGYSYDRTKKYGVDPVDWTKVTKSISFAEFYALDWKGYVSVENHDNKGHKWDAWAVQAADATKKACEARYEVCSCEYCGEKKARLIEENPVFAINPDLKWMLNCYEEEDTWYCIHCGGAVKNGTKEHTKTAVIKLTKPSHQFNAVPDEVIEPTCVSEGKEIYYCIHWLEDARHETDATAIKTVVLAKTAHAFGEWVTFSEYTPGHAGLYLRTCQVCGLVEERRYEGTLADMNADASIPAADKIVWIEYKEDEIPDAEKDNLKANCQHGTGHKFYNQANPTQTYWSYENNQGAHKYEIDKGRSEAATCTKDGKQIEVCSVCKAEKTTVLKKLGHEIVDIPESEPTCTAPGYKKGGTKCTRCDEMTKLGEEIPALGHDYQPIAKVEPTCEKVGYTAGVACTRCSEIILAPVEIPALGHDMGEWKVTTAATCEADGVETRACKNAGCDKIETRPIPMTGHSFGEWKVTVPASCLDGGKVGEKERTCSACGKVEKAEIPALEGHELGDVVVTKEPTCTEAGEGYQLCAVCESKIPAVVPALGHKYGEKTIDVEPTCTKTGLATETCEVCGYINAEKVPALGHTEKVEEGYAPTCGKDGLSDKIYCDVCGEVLVEAKVIPATGLHNYEIVEGKAPTCTEKGATSAIICSVCGDVYLAATELPALGHDLIKTEAKAATCTEDGVTAGQKCTRCDDATIEPEVIKAKGHVWDEGKVTKEAAEGVKGEKVYTCTVCGATQVEEIPALPIPAKYDIESLEYSKPLAEGKVKLDPATDPHPGKLYARVTFFLANGDCMIQIVEVVDGSFKAGAEGNFVHISVVIIDVDDAYDAEAAIEHQHGNGGIEL